MLKSYETKSIMPCILCPLTDAHIPYYKIMGAA